MKKIQSNITTLVDRIGAKLSHQGDLDCSDAEELMSPFIDSMASVEEAEQLQKHLAQCEPCQRQLQSCISVRSLMTRIDRPAPPDDLVLETRVLLSQARNDNHLKNWETRVANILKPIAVPAILGTSLTMLFFGILLGSLASNSTVMANDRMNDSALIALFQPVRTSDPTMIRLAVSENKMPDEPLMVETHVGNDGRVVEYHIISGPADPEINRWIGELLYFSKFTPATAFGRPVDSTIILSFVAVRS